jgi:hypothetical protein
MHWLKKRSKIVSRAVVHTPEEGTSRVVTHIIIQQWILPM